MKDITALLAVALLSGLLAGLSVLYADKLVVAFFYHYYPSAWTGLFECTSLLFSPRLFSGLGLGLLITAVFVNAPAIKSGLRFAGLNLVVALLIFYIANVLTCRPIPELFFEEGLYGFGFLCLSADMQSFPSGHAVATTSFVLSAMMYFQKSWLNLFGIFLIAWVSISNLVLTEHYPSDVLVGVALGGIVCFVNYRLFYKHLKLSPNGTKDHGSDHF